MLTHKIKLPKVRIDTTPKEAVVKNRIMAFLKKFTGSFTFKTHGGPYQQAGLPDIYFLWRGKTLWIEVKRGASEKPTALQNATMALIGQAGGHTIVAHDVETVKGKIAEIWGTAP